jgi:hypothetical protein
MNIQAAIRKAERVLPGKPAPDGKRDPRWQAIMKIEDHIPEHPDEVWLFARKWGTHGNADLRAAIAVLLLEHLLADHFALIFPRVKSACCESKRFSDTFLRCWQLGQAKEPQYARHFSALARFAEERKSQPAAGDYRLEDKAKSQR